MTIRNLSSESERQDYRKIYDIAIGTNYGDSYFPDKLHPNENIIGCFIGDKLVSALHVIDYEVIIKGSIENCSLKMTYYEDPS